jgi:peptidylglycine monooxygenase
MAMWAVGWLLVAFGAVWADTDRIQMPEGLYPQADTYVCTYVPLDAEKEHYITGFEPIVEKNLAHHIILFGCDEPGSFEPVWNCGGMSVGSEGMERASVCQSKESILYAWAMDAPQLELPKDVGFKVGGASGMNYLVMQVHYMHAKNEEDRTGLTLTHTEEPLSKVAATMLLVTAGSIQPRTTENFETACVIDEPVILHPFAYRTHTHRHGKEVSGWVVQENSQGDDRWTLIGRRDPQLPQMFVPVENKTMEIRQGDLLAARCVIENNEDRVIEIGATGEDEMCNFYLMYWTDGDKTLSDNTCLSPGAPNYYWGSEALLNNIPK